MAAMITAASVPVEEYLRTSYEPACEYIDGVLRPKSMGTTRHGLIQYRLCKVLEGLGFQGIPELTLRLSPTKYLIPDVAVDRRIEDPYPTKPVLLCIEILSPEDRIGATLAKCEDYHAWGVPFCWIVDPAKETAWEYVKGGVPVHVERDGVLHAGEILLRLQDLFVW